MFSFTLSFVFSHKYTLANAPSPKQFLIVGEGYQLDVYRKNLSTLWPVTETTENFTHFAIASLSEQIKQAWITNTQVNFCAKAYPTVPADHPDAAALTVLGGFLRNGYLHRAIREQGGAYGGGASQDNTIAAFRFYSYGNSIPLLALPD